MRSIQMGDEAYLQGKLAQVKRGRAFRGGLIRWALLLAVLFAVLHYLLGFAVMQGTAMTPTVSDGAVVMYLRLPGSVKRGDIVLAKEPSGGVAIRRVAAVGGDTITIADTVRVDGVAEGGGYAVGDTHLRDGSDQMTVTLDPGKLFLLGDAREAARDSRDYGAVDVSSVQGRVLASFTWYPLDWMDWLIDLFTA